MNYYELLGVETDCDFKALKKAYYKKVKVCHPDLFNNSQEKTEEFKNLVIAFDTLSDPEKRKCYDYSLGVGPSVTYTPDGTVIMPPNEPGISSIMDTAADDTLEELIVGNAPPEKTSLATLFLDLEKTEVFITFREGKTLFFEKNYHQSISFFRRAVSTSPNNILYRCFLARAYAITGNFSKAKAHYRTAINIGDRRMPRQNLECIRNELELVSRKHLPWWHAVASIFTKEKRALFIEDSDKQMIRETNQAIARLQAEKQKKKIKKLKE